MKNTIIGFLLVISCLSAFSQDGKEYYEKAKEKKQQKDYKYASTLIDKAISLNDTNYWYWVFKSEIELKLNGPKEAMKSIKKAISIDPTNSESFNRLGSFYDALIMPDSAIYMYTLAIDKAKEDTIKHSYISNRGAAKLNKRDFEGALKDFELVLKFNPNNIATLNNIAPTYRQLGKVDKSIESLEKLISVDSTFIGAYINLGFIYTKQDSLDKALEYFDKALEINPNEPLVYSNRGHVYYKKKLYSKALNDINKSIELYPTNAYAYRNLALIYIDTDKMSEACNVLGYAKHYGFTQLYGAEVDELIKKHCK